MFEEKLKRELIKKIIEYCKITVKIGEIWDEYGISGDFDDTESAWDAQLQAWELLQSNEEHQNLVNKQRELNEQINSMLIDTKYFPLLGLNDIQSKVLGFLSESEWKIEEKDIEKYLDILFVKLKDEMKERMNKVKSLYLTKHIETRTYDLYRKVITCYIYGEYEASCVLCRAITQATAERFIIGKGYEDLIAGKNKEKKQMSIQEICLKILGIDKNIVVLYTKIDNKASNILHRKETITEEDMLKIIMYLQEFITGFPALQ